MTKKFIYTLIVSLALGLSPLQAQEEPPPTPDLWPAEIIAPNGIAPGSNNEVKVIVTNLTKDSEVSAPVKVELVVIQVGSGERASYFAEVEGMRHGQKREALFTGVAATSDDSVKLLAIVDPEKALEEANEVNNRRLYQVWVKKPPAPSPSPSPDGEEASGAEVETGEAPPNP